MSMVFCSSLMLEKSSNHSSSTRDLKISLAFVMNKTPYSHFLLTVFTHCISGQLVTPDLAHVFNIQASVHNSFVADLLLLIGGLVFSS